MIEEVIDDLSRVNNIGGTMRGMEPLTPPPLEKGATKR